MRTPPYSLEIFHEEDNIDHEQKAIAFAKDMIMRKSTTKEHKKIYLELILSATNNINQARKDLESWKLKSIKLIQDSEREINQ